LRKVDERGWNPLRWWLHKDQRWICANDRLCINVKQCSNRWRVRNTTAPRRPPHDEFFDTKLNERCGDTG
jgi:hypothetical protein